MDALVRLPLCDQLPDSGFVSLQQGPPHPNLHSPFVLRPTLCAQTRHHCYFVRCMVTMDTHSEHGRMPLTDLEHVNFPHWRLEW